MDYFQRSVRVLRTWLRLVPRKLFKRSSGAATHTDIDKELVRSLSRSRIPSWDQFKYIGRFLSSREKMIVGSAAVVFVASVLTVAGVLYRSNVMELPAFGGTYTEALTGTPKFINPLYAPLSTVDSDIATLVYSGLLKRDENARLVPDLAENYTVSEDKKTYTVTLRENVRWHDDAVLSADDVIFTITAIKNPTYQSPLRASFANVTASKADDRTVVFNLGEPYAAFTELLTTGILPAHVWAEIPAESASLADSNLKPIGTGPYQFVSLAKDAATGTVRVYELAAFRDYFGGQAYMEHIIFRFNPTFQEGVRALNEGRADGLDYLPANGREQLVAKKSYQFHYLAQPQVTALFFNQAAPGALKDQKVRQALAYATDKQALTAANPALTVIDTPVLPLFGEVHNPAAPRYSVDTERARTILTEAGWKLTEYQPDETATTTAATIDVPAGTWYKKGDQWLTVTITTADQPDTRGPAEELARQWQELNIAATVQSVDAAAIQGEIIRPRAYQALLYGYLTGADPDQHPFWHSSQIGAQGFNLANFANVTADKAIEAARTATTPQARVTAYHDLQQVIAEAVPAIFLYSNAYPYIQSNVVRGFDTQAIIEPRDRWSNVTGWYVQTKKRLKLFQ